MTYEEARRMLIKHQAWARSESPRYAEAVDVAINSLQVWDEVLDEIKDKDIKCCMYSSSEHTHGLHIGLMFAKEIIEKKLKEVEE